MNIQKFISFDDKYNNIKKKGLLYLTAKKIIFFFYVGEKKTNLTKNEIYKEKKNSLIKLESLYGQKAGSRYFFMQKNFSTICIF